MIRNWKYVKKTTEEKIKSVESKYNVILPDDLKELVLKNNNGRPDPNSFDTKKNKDRVIKKLLSFNEEDSDNIYTFANILLKETEGLFPFAIEPSGDLICLHNNEIVHLNLETLEVEFISKTVSDFIDMLHE